MRLVPIIIALIVLQLPAGRARADDCKADAAGGLVCGQGPQAFRVIAETTSPSREYAFAWRSSRGFPVGQDVPPPDIENLLVRLKDASVLIRLGGEYWSTGESRANRYDLLSAWSPDSSAVVEIASSRWETDSFKYYRLDGATVRSLDLRALVEPAMRKRLPRAERDSRAFRVREDLPIRLDGRNHLRFTAMLYVPKGDESLDLLLELEIGTSRKMPSAQILSMRRVRSQ